MSKSLPLLISQCLRKRSEVSRCSCYTSFSCSCYTLVH